MACYIVGHGSYRNGDINSYINSYMDTLEIAELTASIRHIARFLKSAILTYDSELPGVAGRNTRRRTQAIAKRYAFHANATGIYFNKGLATTGVMSAINLIISAVFNLWFQSTPLSQL